MNPSKGARVQMTVRISEETRDALLAYKVQEKLDGIPAVLEEWAALRGDRDEELLRARRLAHAGMSRSEALQAVANKALRDARHWKKLAAVRVQRREAKRRAPQVALSGADIERAERTPCAAGCGFFMDPVGLRAGLIQCPSCRETVR